MCETLVWGLEAWDGARPSISSNYLYLLVPSGADPFGPNTASWAQASPVWGHEAPRLGWGRPLWAEPFGKASPAGPSPWATLRPKQVSYRSLRSVSVDAFPRLPYLQRILCRV